MHLQVPYDVVEHILDFAEDLAPRKVSVNTLRSAALVSRAWTSRSQRHLFAAIHFRDSDILLFPRLAFLWTRPRLARFVRSLSVNNLSLPIEQMQAWVPILFPSLTHVTSLHIFKGLRLYTVPSLGTTLRHLSDLTIVEAGPGFPINPDIELDFSTSRLSSLVLNSRGSVLRAVTSALAASPTTQTLRIAAFQTTSLFDMGPAMEFFHACADVDLSFKWQRYTIRLSRHKSSGRALLILAPAASESLNFIGAVMSTIVADQPQALRYLHIQFTPDNASQVNFTPFANKAVPQILPLIPDAIAAQLRRVKLTFPSTITKIADEEAFMRLFGRANRSGIIFVELGGRLTEVDPEEKREAA